MTETQYWQKLRKKIKLHVYAWKINASYQAGVPDWWGSGSRQDLWVEHKRVKNDAKLPPPALDLTNHKDYLSVNQQLWLERRHAEGRPVAVIIFSKVGHIYLPDVSWKDIISRDEYLERAIDMDTMASNLVEILGPIELK